MTQNIDYSAVEFQGYDKSFSTSLNHPEGVLLFTMRKSAQRSQTELALENILLSREPISVPKTEFDEQLETLQGRIADIEGSWQYRKLINFDTTELDSLRSQYANMQRLHEQVREAEPKPVYA